MPKPPAADMTQRDVDDALSRLGMSGAALARALGVHPNTVSRWRRDGAPRLVRLALLALWHRMDEPMH